MSDLKSPGIGDVAPDFEALTDTGDSVKLSDYRGQRVVLYFYPKDDTSGCTKQACGFRDNYPVVEERNAVVLGVSPDGATSHQKFKTKYDLPFTLLSDPDKTVMSEYGAFGEKMMYGKKTVGVIRSTVWVGPDGNVRKHWKRVAKAADHPAKVLAELQAAG